MSGLRKESAITPYPLDPDIAAAVLAARKNDVTAIDDLALEMADHLADQVTHEEASSESVCAAAKKSCPRPLLQRAREARTARRSRPEPDGVPR